MCADRHRYVNRPVDIYLHTWKVFAFYTFLDRREMQSNLIDALQFLEIKISDLEKCAL